MKVGLIGVLALAAALFGAVALSPQEAAAQSTGGGLSTPINCTISGVPQTCTLTVTSFKVVNGVLTAVGTITGPGLTSPVPFEAPVQSVRGSCRILDLVIGPIHLDLLGLVVDLNQVHLQITAQQGSGNLLGNLLCAVAGLLDSGSNTALQQLANLLNKILGAL